MGELMGRGDYVAELIVGRVAREGARVVAESVYGE